MAEDAQKHGLDRLDCNSDVLNVTTVATGGCVACEHALFCLDVALSKID